LWLGSDDLEANAVSAITSLFTAPIVLVALAAIPILGILAWRSRRVGRRSLATLGSPALLRIVDRGRPILRGLGWSLAIALLALTAAGPRWGDGPPPPVQPGCDVVLAVDVSRSMLARDALPNRLERGKSALGDLIDAVQRRGGHRLGLVAFAGQALVVCPLTNDYDHVRAKLGELSADPLPPKLQSASTSGTRIGAGIAAAVAAHDAQFRGAQLIVLVSDGDDPANDDEWRAGYSAARAARIPVFTVGIGDPERESPIPLGDGLLIFDGHPVTSRLHDEPLREIAKRTGGDFITAGTGKPDLSSFVRENINYFPTREAIAGTLPQPVERQALFLAAALVVALLLMLQIRLSQRMRPAVAMAAVLLVSAAGPPDAELRRGIAALDAGRAEEALVHFAAAGERTTDPGLIAFNKGVALYRLERYREAEQRFRWSLSDAEGPRRASALFNLGCSMLQGSQGRRAEPIRNAVASFEASLGVPELDAELRSQASDNLELARRLLAQLPPEKPNHGGSSESDSEPKPPSEAGREPTTATTDDGKPATPGPGERIVNGQGDAPPRVTDRPPTPGKGSLPPIPDQDVLAPMTPDDARSHLEQTAARIAAARRTQLKTKAAMPSNQFPDW
jgi:Ca-activated chloride channel homolog